MIFLNPFLTLGALAFAVPLIVHILNRSRFKTIEWGAMHLLESVVQVNHRRFRLDQLLLLLVRCLIPVLLALCIARPIWTGSKTMNAETPVSLVILLDASYSMNSVATNGSRQAKTYAGENRDRETRLSMAVDSARQLINSAAPGSDFQVLLMAKQPQPLFEQPVFDRNALLDRLSSVQGDYDGIDVSACLQRGLDTLDQMQNGHRELVILSDFQSMTWGKDQIQELEGIKRELDSLSPSPVLTLIPFQTPQVDNLSIQSLSYPDKAVGVGEPLNFRVTLFNHGSSSKQCQVQFLLGEIEKSRVQIEVPAGGSKQALFTNTFESPGSKLIEANLLDDDVLPFDNRMTGSIQVWDQIEVLLVDGDPESGPLRGETGYLRAALAPFALGQFQMTDLSRPKIVSIGGLVESELANSKVVVLANVERLETAQLEALTGFVQAGGLLIVFPGDRINLKWYRESFYNQGRGLLPAEFGERQESLQSPLSIVTERFDHPALIHFNEPSHGDLSEAKIWKWYRLNPEAIQSTVSNSLESPVNSSEELASRPGVFVMARLENTDPCLVERPFGEGMVIQMATSCDTDWNDMPKRPAFLPLMQQLVTTSASRLRPPTNLLPGSPLRIEFPKSLPNETATLIAPDGLQRHLPTNVQGEKRVGRYTSTLRSGVYRVATGKETIFYSVWGDRLESGPELLAENEFQEIADHLNGSVVASASVYLQQDRIRRNGIELWQYTLMAFLGLLFLEVVLQQRFSRVRV